MVGYQRCGYPEDGGDMFLKNADNYLQVYVAPQPRRWQLTTGNKSDNTLLVGTDS